MITYRVEKDGVSFFIQPEQLSYYADSGYRIFRSTEEEVVDALEEMATASTMGQARIYRGEENA